MGINIFLFRHRNKFFFMAVLFAGIAAAYHLYYATVTTWNDRIRHAAFILINLSLIPLFLKRPVYFIVLFFLLTIQQLYSHGKRFGRYLSENNIDWISAAVIIIMPFLLYLLLLEKRSEK